MTLFSGKSEHIIRQYLQSANVQIGGSRPQDISVHTSDFYHSALTEGSLGLGESYMDESWDANNLEVFIEHTLGANLRRHVQWSL